MAARLRPADPADVSAALARLGVDEPTVPTSGC